MVWFDQAVLVEFERIRFLEEAALMKKNGIDLYLALRRGNGWRSLRAREGPRRTSKGSNLRNSP